MLRLSVLWLNCTSWSKSYYWQPIGSRLYEKSIGTKMNDLDLCLDWSFKVMSTIPTSITPKLLELETSNLVHGFVWECRALGDEWRSTGAIVCVITKSAILISAQFNISPHNSFMVQNQITMSLCLTIYCYLTVGFCILDSLLWGSTVGYPSDSLASCYICL